MPNLESCRKYVYPNHALRSKAMDFISLRLMKNAIIDAFKKNYFKQKHLK